VEPATINGIVFDDENQNGELDAEEIGISEVTVFLDDTIAQTTDGDGNYSFSGVENGTHTLSVTEPAGYFLTTDNNPYTFDVTGLASVNFGFALMTTTSTTTTTEESTTTTTAVPTTTTVVPSTTTTIPEEGCLVVSVEPAPAFLKLRAGLMPTVRRIVITGEDSNWDRTSVVSIEDILIAIPLRVQPTKMFALIVIPSKLFGRFTPGEKEVGVATGAEVCTGTVDIQ
jgi:hypothetical protein